MKTQIVLVRAHRALRAFFEILDVQLLNQNSPSIDGDGIQSAETRSRVVTSTTFLHQTVDPEVAVKSSG